MYEYIFIKLGWGIPLENKALHPSNTMHKNWASNEGIVKS